MSLAAVIVDCRNISLFQVITEHLYFLPKDTKLYVFSSENQRHLQELLNCEFHVVDINSISDYNRLLTSKSFWEKIEEENILIFQEDSRLLRKGIEEFYQWDYVGASWNFAPYVGNGGLSFRHKSAMIEICEAISWTGELNEDIYFSYGCQMLNLKLAPVGVANKFSVETQFHLGAMGYHAIEKWLTEEQCKKIKKQYEHEI